MGEHVDRDQERGHARAHVGRDAKGLLAAAIHDPDPVVVLEPKLIYCSERTEVPDGEHVVPLGKARLAREGSDVTLVAYGAMVPLCERVAEALSGEASVEVLDLRGPVLRVTGYDVPYPYWSMEDAHMPSAERVVDAARTLLAF